MNIEAKTRRILLTGARAPVTLELARMFASAGHTVFAADSIRYHGCRVSQAVKRSFLVAPPRQQCERFIQDLLSIIQNERIDLLISTCEEIFYVAAALPELSQHCRVLTEPLSRLEELHHKYRFIQLLQAFGLSAPQTLLCRSIAEVEEALHAWSSNQPVVVKPVFSRFGSRVRIVSDQQNPLAEREVTPSSPWLVQEYVAGTEYSTYSVASNGNVLAHTTYSGSFRAGIGASIAFSHREHARIERWVADVVGRLNFTGQIAFDLIETADGKLYPLECNPRATSGIHLLAAQPGFADVFFAEPPKTISPGKEKAMLAPAMLLYGLPAVRSWAKLEEWVQTVRSSRDVLFRKNDPLPALGQLVTMLTFVKRSVRHNESLLAAATHDIEWNGGKP